MDSLYRSGMMRTIVWAIGLLCLSMLLRATPLPDTNDKRNRSQQDERVELLHADNWRYDQYEYPDAQRLSGNVRFKHGGMYLSCDSAVFFQVSNSFEAYGHVRMLQGDTLSLTSNRLYYRGDDQMAEARENVVMKHRMQTLYTDSLNYDRLYGLAYFFEGGKLEEGDNVLTSDWGEYHTDTRLSTFNYKVELNNPKFRLITDTLHYDTNTKWAEVIGPSNIYSGENRIYTEHGFYNTQSEQVKLFERSKLFGDESEMEGDSIFYDKKTGDMRAFRNVHYDDKKSKYMLLGDFCTYNELTGAALSYGKALAKDYSNQSDTLFVHADTLRLYTYNIRTDSIRRVLHGYFHVRAFRTDVQAVADSLVFDSRERKLSLYRDPIVWSGNRQIVGEEINVYSNDSTIDSIYVRRQALLVEQMDSVHYNQVAAQLMRSYFEKGEMFLNCADGNVYVINFPLEKDSLILYQNYTETSKLKMYMEHRKLRRLWAPAAEGCFYAVGTAPHERTYLSNFAWFDYIRPRDKYDLFEWRGKKAGTELKPSIRREPPLQKFDKEKKAGRKVDIEPIQSPEEVGPADVSGASGAT